MNRTRIINDLARRTAANTYLEIGVRNPADNFEKIDVIIKVGVDPKPNSNPHCLTLTSDEYFERDSTKYDLIFIDGDHSHEQSLKDALNALTRLTPGGLIVLHDCLPKSFAHTGATKPNNGQPWNGDVWLTFANLQRVQGLDSIVVDRDHGVGIIRKREDALAVDLEPETPPYELRFHQRTFRGMTIPQYHEQITPFLKGE